MSPRLALILCALLGGVACAANNVLIDCQPMASPAELTQRTSPYDSAHISVGDRRAQICYSRPSANGRVVFGGLVPFDSLWRTGANEPTVLHLPFDAEIAGLTVAAGHYSLYTVPALSEWQLVINRSIGQWGITRDETRPDGGVNRSAYTAEVAAQEIGRVPVSADSIEFVEQFTIRAEPSDGDSASVFLEWERTRVRIPIRATQPPRDTPTPQ